MGVTIDNDLKFNEHVSNICLNANRKLSALTRMAKYLNFKNKRVLYKAFSAFESQFKYCPLVWMFHSRTLNNKINRLHERALRIVYNDYITSFDDLLIKDRSFTVHHRNIQFLLIELFKILHGLSKGSFADIFHVNQDSVLRSNPNLFVPSINTVSKGENSLRYYGSIIWNSLPPDIKNISSFNEFKAKIKKWRPVNCPCRLCKEYITGIGFVNLIE